MKLRLPHKFQAALLAAIASVSFTTLSTGTITAAGVAFFGHQAFADDTADTADADDPDGTIDTGDTNLDAQAAIDEEEGTGKAKEPDSAPINMVGFNAGPGNNAGLLVTESVDIDETALVAVAGSGQQDTVSVSEDTTPSTDFTANPYDTGSDTSNGSDDFSLTGTAPAAAYVPGQSGSSAEEGDSAAGTGSGSSTNKTATGDIGSIGGTGSGAIGGFTAPLGVTDSAGGSTLDTASWDTLGYELVGAAAGETRTIHVYILTGQSNSLGSVKGSPAPTELLDRYATPFDEAMLWNGNMNKGTGALHETDASQRIWKAVLPQKPVYEGNACMGPEYGFAYMMERYGWQTATVGGVDHDLAIIKTSLDGGDNTYWYKGTNAYKSILSSIETAVSQLGQDVQVDLSGLLYLQGESDRNNTTDITEAKQRYLNFLTNLKTDLAEAGIDASQILIDSVVGEPANWNGRDNQMDGTTSAKQFLALSQENANVDFVYTRDLTKITSGDGYGVHYDGKSEITIGARYAYAMARQKGWSVHENGRVRSQEYGDAQLDEQPVSLNEARAWWRNADESSWTVASLSDEVAVWDLSSANMEDTLTGNLTVKGIRVEDPFRSTVVIKNSGSVNATLSIGDSGVQLQYSDLNLKTNVATTADQTWSLRGNRVLSIDNVSLTGNHRISVQRAGDTATASVVLAGADSTHSWLLGNGTSLAAASLETVEVAAGANVALSVQGSVASLTMGSGAGLYVGGENNVQPLSISNLILGGDATIYMDFNSPFVFDSLHLGTTSGTGALTFDFNVRNAGSGGDFTVVYGWNSNYQYAASGLAEGYELTARGGNLVLVVPAGESSHADYSKAWPSDTQTPGTTPAGGTFDASASGTNALFSSGATEYFYGVGSNRTGAYYAEARDVAATKWLVVVGSGSTTSPRTLDGSASLLVSSGSAGTARNTNAAFSATNATVTGDVYLELADPNITYVGQKENNHTFSVFGLFSSSVAGDNTVVIRDGVFNSKVTAGASSWSSGQSVENVYLDIKGGTFKDMVTAAGSGVVNGNVYLAISGGDFSNNANGIYAGGYASSSQVSGNTTTTVERIDANNAFASYTGVLSGSGAAGSVAGAKELILSEVVTNLQAQLQGFNKLTVTDASETTLKYSQVNGWLQNTTLTVSRNSSLTIDSENNGWTPANLTLQVDEGSTFTKTGGNWFNFQSAQGAGKIVAEAGLLFADLSGFNGIAEVKNGNNMQVTTSGAGVGYKINSASGLTIGNTSGALGTLSGEGTVSLTNAVVAGNGDTATSFAFAEDWTGTVKLSESNIASSNNQELYLSKYGKAGSTIELNGVGNNRNNLVYLANGDANIVNANLKLSGNGLRLNAGSKSGVATFNGSWSGSGAFQFTYDTSQTFRFLGDMTAYSGEMSVNGRAVLEFGNGTTMGIAVGSVSGAGTITGTNSGQATILRYNYIGDVNAGNLIAGNVNLEQNGPATLTLTAANTYTGITSINKGTLALAESGRLGSGQVTLSNANFATLKLGDNAVIETNGANAVISNHSVVNANSIQGASSDSLAAISNASIAVAAGKSLELGNVALNNVDLSGHVNLTSSVTADAMVIKSGSTFDLAGLNMITVAGKLTLESGATLDLARLFETQPEPVQNAPLRVRSSGSPLLLSSLGESTSALSVDSNLDSGLSAGGLLGAATPVAGDYVLATANDISLVDGVQLQNVAQGYTGTLKTQDAGGNKQLILTLTADYDGLIWNGPDGDWSNLSTDANWHTEAAPTTPVAFTTGSDVRFDSNANGHTVTLTDDISADVVTVDKNVAVTVVHNTRSLNGTLAGYGTYALANTVSELPSGLSLGSDWHGVVQVTGATTGTTADNSIGTVIQNLTRGDSWVKLSGVQGYLGGDNTYTGNIILENSDNTSALTITSSEPNKNTVLMGDIKGAGDIERKIGNGNSLTFYGDISGWRGTYYNGSKDGSFNTGASSLTFVSGGEINANFVNTAYTNNCNLTLNFQGDDTIVNGELYSQAASGKTSRGLIVNVNGNTTFNNRLDATSLTVSAGKTATMATDATVSGVTTNNGYLVLGDGTTYTVHATSSNQVQKLGNISVEKSATIVNHWQNAQVNLDAIDGGANSELTLISSHCSTASNFNIGAADATTQAADAYKGTLVLADRLTDGTSGRTANFNLRDGGLLDGATLQIQNFDTKGKTMTNNISLQAATVKVGGVNDADASTVDSTHLWKINSGLSESGVATLQLTGTGNYSSAVAINSNVNLLKTGSGTQTLSGNNANMNGTVTVNAGTLVVGANGALGSGTTTVNSGGTLELTNTVSTLSNTINIAYGGTLALGNYKDNAATISNLTLASGSILDLTAFTDITGQEESITLVNGGNIDSSYLSGVQIEFASEIQGAHLGVQNGNLVLTFAQPEPGKDLIWDGTSNTWASGSSQHWHEDGSETLVSFTNGDSATFNSDSSAATVTVSGSVMAGRVTVEDDANVTLVTGNGNTLTAGNGITVDGTLVLDGTSIGGTLSGEGVVVGNAIPVLADGKWTKADVLGSGVTFGDDWTGTVEVSGGKTVFSAPYVILDTIDSLGTENSTVRLKGVGGYFTGGTINPDIELVNLDDASPAVLVTAGNGKTTTFNGDIFGSGDLVFNKLGGSEETFCFTGNLSAWDGSLKTLDQAQSDKNGALTVQLTGTNQVVNASIIQEGTRRALNVVVDTAATFNNLVDVSKVQLASDAVAVFNGTVDAGNVTLGSGSTATFKNTAEIDTLAGAGKLVVDGAGTTTIASGNGFTGGIDLLGGTLDLTTALTGVGAVNLDAGTLKLAAGGNALGSTGTITLGSDLTLDLSNYSSTLEPGQSITLATATGGYIGDESTVQLTGLDLADDYRGLLSQHGNNLVLSIVEASKDLVWITPSGTWGAQGAWYKEDKTTRATFTNGDNVTIDVADFEDVAIHMNASASAGNMTVKKGENVNNTRLTISDADDEYRLGVQNLTLEKDTYLQAASKLEVSQSITVGQGAGLGLVSGQDATISANISSQDNSASIIKANEASTVTLTGDNSGFTGILNVAGGKLVAESATALGTGDVVVAEGAELSLAHRDAMEAGSLTLEGGSTVSFVGDTTLTLDSDLILRGSVIWDLRRFGFGGDSPITLISVGGDMTGAEYLTDANIIKPSNITSATLSYTAGEGSQPGSVLLTFTMADQRTLYWKGGVGNWTNDASVQTWHPSRETASLTHFVDHDNVVFDNRTPISSVTLRQDEIIAGTVTVEAGTQVSLQDGTGKSTLVADSIAISGTLGTNVNVDSALVDIDQNGRWIVSGEKDRVFSGQITGEGSLAKSSSGDLRLSGDNSGFSGNIQLNDGSITAANANALGTGTTIAMGDGTELKGSGVNMGGKTIEVTNSGAIATVSANLNIKAADLTVDSDGSLVLGGDVSGDGRLLKDGFGTVVLSGNLDSFAGTTVVKEGTLALESDFTTGSGFDLMIGSRLQLAEQNAGTGQNVSYGKGAYKKTLDISTINFQVDGTLALRDGTYLDMSNIHLNSDGVAGIAKFNQLQAVDADPIGDLGDPYYYEFIEGIAIENLEGTGGTTYARLVRDDKNHLLYVQTFGDTNGAYWKGDADTGVGEWNRGGSQSMGTTSQWRTEQNGETKANYNWSAKVPMSAYFFELTDSQGKIIDETTVTLVTSFPQVGTNAPAKGSGDVIIDGATKYKFVSTDDNYLTMNTQYPVALIVRSGSTAEFDFGIDAANGSWISVEKDAALTFDTRTKTSYYSMEGADFVQLYNVTNDGTMDVIAGATWLKHVVNNSDMTIKSYEDLYGLYEGGGSSIEVSVVYNARGATLLMSGEAVTVNTIESEQQVITNDGLLVFNGSSITESTSKQMLVTVPVVGAGVVRTGEEEDSDAEVLFSTWRIVTVYDDEDEHLVFGYERGSSTVENSALELGANITTFEEGVNITDSTTVYSGKHANFYGGGILDPELPDKPVRGMLGDVTLQAGTAEDATELVFGPKAVYELNESAEAYEIIEYTNTDYLAGQVVAGENSTLEVERGATVMIDDFNAGTFATPTGEIEVGTFRDTMTEGVDASLTISGAAAVDTITMHDNGLLVVEGNANINRIMQDGGVLTLNADSVLNGTDDGHHQGALTGGTVTGGKLVLAGGKTLDQNAVVDVREGGTYTVDGGSGSRIDASSLELDEEHENRFFREVVVQDGKAIIKDIETQNQSGFVSSGDEFVKLFDIEYRDEVAQESLISNNEAVYHSAASNMMTLIGTDNWEDLQIEGGYDLSQYIGYGYLHTSDLALKTYYVRDTYTEDNCVTLSNIIEASKVENPETHEKEAPQLENVVFDKTEYNTDFSPYNGTLTVDADVKVDLFSVSEGVNAAINIASGTTVTADADSPGVQGNLDLQGAGVYEIQNRNDLGANIALRDNTVTPGAEWDGTVRVTGTSTDLTLEDKSVGKGADASTIEFRNWNGALNGGEHTHTVEGKVNLVGTGAVGNPAAMTLTGEDAIDYTFSNTVTGQDALISHTEGGDVAMAFRGDTSGWTGDYNKSSAGRDTLIFTGGSVVNAGVAAGAGTMNVTYGGDVAAVNGDLIAYSAESPTTMNVAFEHEGNMAVESDITSDAQSKLILTVGDGQQATNATFTGTFAGTENATMAVQSGSTATIGTDAELLRVVGDEGSNVVVNSVSTLSLASTDPETGYSVFHNLTNNGTIEMKASGGDIRLVDDNGGATYSLGKVLLTGETGTATIETSGVAGAATNVNISDLSGPKDRNQVLELTNNAAGTVNYNIESDSEKTDLRGTIAYGVTGDGNAETNLVIKDDGTAASRAVLQSTFSDDSPASASANVIVDTDNGASVLGLTSDGNSADKSMVVRGTKVEGKGNRMLQITGNDDYEYDGALGANLDVAYTGIGRQAFKAGVQDFNGAVIVGDQTRDSSVLAILNNASVEITDLVIGENDTLDLGGANGGEAVVSGTLWAQGDSSAPSKVDGSLTLGSGSTYNVSAARGIGGLNLTGALTITQGAMLSTSDMATVWNMKVDDMYDLAFGVTDMSSFGSVDWEQGVDASTVFGNGMKEGEFVLRYSGKGEGGNGSNVGAVYLFRVAVPEPTTSTLSLLALAALAARRRRKG